MASQQYSLLVVDDNEMNRDMLTRRLERQGYRVTVAVDGRQALEVLDRENFNLVLLDIMLPVINGYQVLEQMKADQALSHIPVIITTALDEADGKAKCMDLGAEDYLTKPFNPVTLKSRISDCLNRHHRA
ncbi:MAG: hypothetical protein BZY87_01535 [SAR202 cluster bacterium Io17-Chloro-G6]|nr:MAG: hypothetical protein BZY87_01535 [SAR202 cluster bacterium Io17-Chloro-G6]